MDKADLLSRTCAYIGLLCSFIAFYFVLSYFDSPKKTAPTYTEITFTLQKDEPLIKQDQIKQSNPTPPAAVKNPENEIATKKQEAAEISQNIVKEPQKIPNAVAVPKSPDKPKAAAPTPKRPQAAKTVNKPKKHVQSNAQKKASKTTTAKTTVKNSAAVQSSPNLKQQQMTFANLIYRKLQSSLTYPELAVRRNLEGTAVISFTIKQGKITSYKISTSSGHKILDDAALKLAAKIANLSVSYPLDFNLNVPLKYELH